ncbi:MAG: hypothetical protein KQH57_09395 [Actinomycetales bacterium]|nr:hypothetical protein [Actinomycetales bacterium]
MPASRRRARFVVPAVALTASLAGCAAAGTRTGVCVDWVSFTSPAEASAEADLVVLTTGPAVSAGTSEIFGTAATVHAVEVSAVLKGTDAAPGQALGVISAPETCTGASAYPQGDPLAASGQLIVFLHWDADAEAWRTITPYQGVVPATADGQVPDSWPPA